MEYKGFCGPSYTSQSTLADGERTVNMYLEKIESPGAPARVALYPFPGLELLADTNSSNGRAHEFWAGREFMIIGPALVELDIDANVTFRGFVAVDTNPATISYNGDGGGELFITSGGNGYLYDLATDTLSSIANLAGKATMGDQLDGFFLALDASDGTLYASELLDGATWNTGTMFSQRNAAPDPWVSMKVMGKYIYLLGPETQEVWFDAGNSPFPFAPHPSGLLSWGISAPFSLKVCDTSLCWLGGSKGGTGFVLRNTGFSPEPISNYPLQYAIDQFGAIADAVADTMNYAGHTFYILTLPTANKTFCYDLQMGVWVDLGCWDPASTPNDFGAYRPRCHAVAFGEHRWLHGSGTGVYRTDPSSTDDVDGLAIRYLRRPPALIAENERLFIGALELNVEPGLGTSTGQGAAPRVMLRASKDGGKTWGSERWSSAGAQGEYQTRCNWHRMGTARRWVPEVSMTDPIPWRVMGAWVDVQPSMAVRGAA